MEDDTTYHGWENWETWDLFVWLTNEEGSDQAARRIARGPAPWRPPPAGRGGFSLVCCDSTTNG
jgi:hypothetical protein